MSYTPRVPLLVVSGTYAEFVYWRSAFEIPYHRVRHVSHEGHVMGCDRGSFYTTIGTWDLRPYRDMKPIMDALQIRAKFVEDGAVWLINNPETEDKTQ